MRPEDIAALPYRRCVGVVLANPKGLVFAGQRIDNPGPAWQMPQGGIDPGEEPQDAALRELWEETGVTRDKVSLEGKTEDWVPYDLPHDLVPKLWKGRYRGQEQLWYLLRFHGSDADIRIDTDHPEFSRWQWMAPNDLIQRIVPFKQHIYRHVFDIFGDRL